MQLKSLAAGGMKILVGSCWLGVVVCFDVPIRDLRVKELNLCRGPMGGELDDGMVVVEVSDEVLEVGFPMRPNHKHIINISPPSQGLQGLRGEEILLWLTHEYVGIGRGHAGTHSCTL